MNDAADTLLDVLSSAIACLGLPFTLLDTVVGLGVAVLILKSAVELGLELLRAAEEGDLDLSHYRLGLFGGGEGEPAGIDS